MLEAALTLPVILTLFLAVIHYALLWHARNVAEAAAQTGLHAARAYQATPDTGRSAARTYLRQVAPRLLPDAAVSVTQTATTVSVTVTACARAPLSFLPCEVQENATAERERFTTPAPPRSPQPAEPPGQS